MFKVVPYKNVIQIEDVKKEIKIGTVNSRSSTE